MQSLLLLHSNNGFVNAPRCYVIRSLPLFVLVALTVVLFDPTVEGIVIFGISVRVTNFHLVSSESTEYLTFTYVSTSV
jgi:hypothetical protein